jgi:carboxypeptidase C (cathepsin A)
MRKALAAALLAAGLGAAMTAAAQPKTPEKTPTPAPTPEKPGEKSAEVSKKETPRAESSVTQHSAVIGGAPVAFTATAGTLIVRNAKEEPWASIGYVAYVRKDAGSPVRRPIAFCYNGGPGSSSVWLHMGALGPRRVVVADGTATPPPPYQVVDNAYSLLDKADIVLIDPVGTGISKPVGDFKEKDFWGVDPDIESVSRFIKQYVTDNGRWNSAKYLIGESYGTTRSAGVVDWLQSKGGMTFNGVVLVSVATDLGAIFALPGNDQPYPLYLPSYAAAAWYHKLLPNPPKELEPWLTEVRRYAAGEFAAALAEGSRLPDDRRAAVAKKLHDYTGLSEDYLRLANLRVSESEFTQELLRQRGITVGRLDSRFVGPTMDPLAKETEDDPQSNAITGAYTAAFLDWYHEGLKFGDGKTYNIFADAFLSWDFRHKVAGVPFPLPTLTNTNIDLGHAMHFNPNLQVLVLNGLFDLATPFFATETMMAHVSPDKDVQARIALKYYPAGHMMYVNEASLKAMKADMADFVARTSK